MSYKKTDPKEKKHTNDPNISDRKGSISERLRMLANRGKTREVAQKWGVSTSTLDRYINQGSMPSIDRAIAIAEAEGVSIQWLTSGEEANESHGPIINEPKDCGTYQKLIDAIETMPQEAQSKLYMRIISKGFNSLDISERDDRILALVADMSDEHFKEIYAFVHKAKYMLLAGLPIGKPADVDDWDEKRA